MSYANKGSGSGSYSYHSSYNCGDDHSPIPVVRCKKQTDSLVELNVYAIDGTSASGSSIMAGITGVDIKHTSIVAFGVEYEFSQVGVDTKVRRRNSKPVPVEVIQLGYTLLSVEELNEHVEYLRRTKYKCSTYNARSLNCHNFSNELSLFLTDTPIPDRFLKMGEDVTSQTKKVAVGVGAVAAAGLLAYSLRDRQHERQRQAEENNNGLLTGIGALAVGGLAYHLLSSKEEKPQNQAMQQSSGIGGAGILGALAAGAAGLAYALNDEPAQQPRRQAGALRWPGIEDNNAAEDGPADWIQRMFN